VGEHYVAMRLNMLGIDTGLVPAGNPTTEIRPSGGRQRPPPDDTLCLTPSPLLHNGRLP
jgi:hypothetical protein